MNQRHCLRERRRPNRPSNGDSVLCRKCARETLEFNERYRIPLEGGRTVVTPAWVCDCGYREIARYSDDPLGASDVLRSAPITLRKPSHRQMLKVRTLRVHANRVLQRSAAHRKSS